MAHGQQGNLVFEIHEPFHDHPALAGAAAGLRVVPGGVDVLLLFHQALALAGGRHHRFHHTGQADITHRRQVLLPVAGETVGRRVQAQLFRRQPADAFAVHGQAGGAGGGHHGDAFLLQLEQLVGGDGLDLRHDEVRPLLFHHAPYRGAVEHVDHVAAVGHLHGRRVGVAVHGDHFAAQPHQLDADLFAQFAGAQQQHASGAGRIGGAQSGHGGGSFP